MSQSYIGTRSTILVSLNSWDRYHGHEPILYWHTLHDFGVIEQPTVSAIQRYQNRRERGNIRLNHGHPLIIGRNEGI